MTDIKDFRDYIEMEPIEAKEKSLGFLDIVIKNVEALRTNIESDNDVRRRNALIYTNSLCNHYLEHLKDLQAMQPKEDKDGGGDDKA